MTNILRLRGADGSIALFQDRTKVEWFKKIDPPNPTIQRTISQLGCGAAPGATASLDKDLYMYVTLQYDVGFWDDGKSINTGASFQQVVANVQEFEHQVLKAKWHNLDFTNPTVQDGDGNNVTATAVWLERVLYDQGRPEIWTILTGTEGKSGRIHEERYGMPRIVLHLELLAIEGAKFLDPNGYPMDGGGGGTGFAFSSFPTSSVPSSSGTATLSPVFF